MLVQCAMYIAKARSRASKYALLAMGIDLVIANVWKTLFYHFVGLIVLIELKRKYAFWDWSDTQ